MRRGVILERAVARGELGPHPLPDRIKALPSDLLRHELFMSMRPASPETIAEIVDGVFLPLATSLASDTSNTPRRE